MKKKEVGNGKKEKKYTLTKKGKREVNDATRRFCALFYDIEGEFRKSR
ncbi:MAG TPA: hypothetical protein VJB90_02710 [Candidatus Nanoarchaeia archaeon]|nr:hypothetical protein [Candidatus Nanoarchaeia archaeon]